MKIKAFYEIDYFPGVTAELKCAVSRDDPRYFDRQVVKQFGGLREAKQYAEKGYASRGHKAKWNKTDHEGFTRWQTQTVELDG
jgi:hypothetical protein